MDYLNDRSSLFLSHKREFADFLELEPQKARLRDAGANQSPRFLVNLSELQSYDRAITERFLMYPMQHWPPWTAALKEALRLYTVPATDSKLSDSGVMLGVEGEFGSRRLSPRQLQAHHLGQLLCVEGIVTKVSLVRPKVERTVHFCEATGEYTEREYFDHTSLSGQYRSTQSYPQRDNEGNPLTTEFGFSQYGDHQTIAIQEMPERSPAGLLPSAIEIVLDHDLVDRCKPGDRVQIIGIFRALPSKHNAESSGVFKAVIIAANLRHISRGEAAGDHSLTDRDIRAIRDQSQRPDIFDAIARSIAPSIHGHPSIKKALALLMLGGVEKNLPNGTHIRGDINLLMVGDPSTAKSQLLRFVLSIAPLAINTTGRGSSGVGLTAAVIADRETGDRRLEAGAMVLADRGIVCIDEFDKMSDADRVAIHEVMEQQTVTIAKAGIHMQLNARCSVVAAANPRYSQYDKNKSPAFNVHLPDSLLSRFDLLFIVLDEPDAHTDRLIADHVLSNHRFGATARNETEQHDDTHAASDDSNEDDGENQSAIFQKRPMTVSDDDDARDDGSDDSSLYKMSFLRKYFEFAKSMCQPVLNLEAAELITSSYAELRQTQAAKSNGYPITARCLETLIRLSSAHAKLRLDPNDVTIDDVRAALRVLESAIEGTRDSNAKERQRQSEAKNNNDSSDEDDDDQDRDDEDGNDRGHRRRLTAQEEAEQKQKRAEDDRQDGSEDEHEHKTDEAEEKTHSPSRRRRRSEPRAMQDEDDGLKSASPRKRVNRAAHSSLDTEAMDLDTGASDIEPQPVYDFASARGRLLKKLLSDALKYTPIRAVDEVRDFINTRRGGSEAPFEERELLGWVSQLDEAQVMYDSAERTLFRA